MSDGLKQIPIKWTAPEALNYGKYTSLCDVWSFGVLAWEIFSKGGTPYQGMTNTRARELIDSGYRMPAPEGTPDEVYQLMLRLVILIVGVEQLRSRLAVGLSLRSTLMFLFNDKKTLKRMQSCHIKLRLTDMIRCIQQKDLQNIFMNNGLPCPHFLPLRLSRACTDWPKVKWPI